MDLNETVRIKRITHRNATPVVAADFALSAGFGSTASIAVVAGSTDASGQATITCGGSGHGANPTATLTFSGGAWKTPEGATHVPFVLSSRAGGSQPTIPLGCVATATAGVFTFAGTASGTETYVFTWGVP